MQPSTSDDEVFDADDIYDTPPPSPSAPPHNGTMAGTLVLLTASSTIDSNAYDKPVEPTPTSQSKYAWHMELASVLLFVLGSILYLVCAVYDYQWSQVLLTLPEWIRGIDDDAVWIRYRLEEQYGNVSSLTANPYVVERRRMGGVRRRLMREYWGRLDNENYDYYEYDVKKGMTTQIQRKLQQTPEELNYDLDWACLPPEIQDAYTVLGWSEDAWDKCQDVPETDSMTWDELTPEQQEAALFIGYTEMIWSEWDDAFVKETDSLTRKPTNEPTSSPTLSVLPTISPTDAPTLAVSERPSLEPSVSSRPTLTIYLLAPDGSTYHRPTESPTGNPTLTPSVSPTSIPSSTPSLYPSYMPSPSPTEATVVSDSAAKTPEELYEDEWWRDLPPDIQDAYAVLGWNETGWDESIYPPSGNMKWDELSIEMQRAATYIGYSQEMWDRVEGGGALSNNTQVDDNYYEDYNWVELPPDVKDAAVTLGWDQSRWDDSGSVWSDNFFWEDLPPDAQEAASVFGYDQVSWNAGGDPQLEALFREAGGTYISNDDDYVFDVGPSHIWVSKYHILYFFAALCFVFTGILGLIRQRAPFHLLMVLAGAFGVASALLVEENIFVSTVLDMVSVHLYLMEGIGMFLKDRRSELIGEGKLTRWAITFADSEFVSGAILDVMLSYFYLLDDTVDWDPVLQITWVFSAVLWLHCALIYLGVFMYDTEAVKKELRDDTEVDKKKLHEQETLSSMTI